MLVYYSSDNCIEYRPWLAYLTFPAIVIATFVLASRGHMPNTRSMLFSFLINISGLVILAHMFGAFFVVWTFGRAVCSKVGNIMYVVTIGISIGIGSAIISGFDEDKVWLLSWFVHCLAGMYLVFCPLNCVDGLILIPPFKTLPINGLLAVIVWLVVDFLLCVSLGWGDTLFVHPISFLFGVIWASVLLKIPFISDGIGDRTLWQWIIGDTESEDLAWQESWSEKRKNKEKEEHEQEDSEELLKEKEKDIIKKQQLAENQDTTSVLCKCGHIVHAPAKFEGKSIKCPACNHGIHVPKLSEFEDHK